jgi:hypothetical protein
MVPSVTMRFSFTVRPLEWLLPINPDLSFFPTDSGHGGQTRDLNGDEIDGYDEGQSDDEDLLNIYHSLINNCSDIPS